MSSHLTVSFRSRMSRSIISTNFGSSPVYGPTSPALPIPRPPPAAAALPPDPVALPPAAALALPPPALVAACDATAPPAAARPTRAAVVCGPDAAGGGRVLAVGVDGFSFSAPAFVLFFEGDGIAPAPAGKMPSLEHVPSLLDVLRRPMSSDGSAVRAGLAPAPRAAARAGALRDGAGANVLEKRCCETGAGRGAGAGRELCGRQSR